MSTFKNSKVAKAASVFVSVATSVMMMGSLALPVASAATLSELQAQINALLAQIQTLSGGSSVSTGASLGFTFTKNLKSGDRNADVMNLQKVLNMKAATQVAASGAGSPGNETTYFGPATKKAVIKFQELYAADVLAPVGLTSGTGVVGAATRAKLNAIAAGSGSTGTGSTGSGSTGTTTTPPVSTASGSSLVVSSGVQPANNLAPQSATRVPFTTFTLTAGNDGDVAVNGVTVERDGLAQDSVFSGVVLLDEQGQQLGIAKTLNSDHRVTIGDTFIVPRGTTKKYTIAGNMNASLATLAGQVAVLSLVGVNTSATVSGSLPISGAQNTINATLAIGTATAILSSFDPNTASTQSIGTTGFKFAGLRITAGSAEKVRLSSIRWNQSGSASGNDLANVNVVVDGIGTFPTTLSTDGKYYTAVFPGSILIDKGFSKDVYVTADVVGSNSSGRTVQFDINKQTDVYMTGETYGYGVLLSPAGNTRSSATTAAEFLTSDGTTSGTISTPFFDASKITVSAGSVTSINKAVSVAAQNIAVNVPNQVLGGYELDLKGEPVSVQTTSFTVASSSGSGSGLLTNVTIVDENGKVVAGPVDATGAGTSLTFTDTITYALGKHVYTLKGKVASTIGNGTVYTLSTTPSSQWSNVTGQTTGNTISLSSLSSSVAFNQMTVKSGNLAIAFSTDPGSQTIVAGGTQRLFARLQLDATQSGEDLRTSSLALVLDAANDADLAKLTSCQLFDGSLGLNTGTNVVNPTGTDNVTSQTFTFDQSLVIPKGTIKTLDLKCNVAASATGPFVWKMTVSSSNPTVTGTTSSNSITATGGSLTGPTMAIGAGSLTIDADASAPSYTVASAGTTGLVAGALRFRANNQAVNLQKIGLKLTNTASSSATDLVQVSVWDGATQIGTATFTGGNTVATSTFNSPILLAKDTDKVLTLKLDLANISSSGPVLTSGHLVAVDINSADTAGTEGTGVESGTTINLATSGSSGSSSFAGVRVFKSYPTLAIDTLPGTGVADGRLMRFKVTASAAGPVGIEKFTVTVATSSASVTGLNVFGYTDSAYSQGIAGINQSGQLMTNNLCSSGCTSNSPTLSFYPQNTSAASTTIQVPAGQTRFFEIRGTVAAASGATNFSVTTTLVGDSVFPALYATSVNGGADSFMASTTAIDGFVRNIVQPSRSFIWSPNSTTTSGLTANDWTNGFGLPGLPSNGIINTRSN